MGFFDKILNKNVSNGPLPEEWTRDRTVTLDKMPDNLEELKAAVDVTDPGSVAAYFVYAVAGLPGDYDTGMSMMKYLFADIEPFGRGFIEGGGAGRRVARSLFWILARLALHITRFERGGNGVQAVIARRLNVQAAGG